jgi:hypothetical protein
MLSSLKRPIGFVVRKRVISARRQHVRNLANNMRGITAKIGRRDVAPDSGRLAL